MVRSNAVPDVEEKAPNERIRGIFLTASQMYSRTRAKVNTLASSYVGRWGTGASDATKQDGENGPEFVNQVDSTPETQAPLVSGREEIEAIVAKMVDNEMKEEDEADNHEDEQQNDDPSEYEDPFVEQLGIADDLDEPPMEYPENDADHDSDSNYEEVDVPMSRIRTSPSQLRTSSGRRMSGGKVVIPHRRRRRSSASVAEYVALQDAPAVTSPARPLRVRSLMLTPKAKGSLSPPAAPKPYQSRKERRALKRKSGDFGMELLLQSVWSDIFDVPMSECLKEERVNTILLPSESSKSIEVSLKAEQCSSPLGSELAWEFSSGGDNQLQFSIHFVPNELLAIPECFSPLMDLVENSTEARFSILSPATFTATPAQPHRGNLMTSRFPPGTFVFTWTNEQKKGKPGKELSYRVRLRSLGGSDTIAVPLPRQLELADGASTITGHFAGVRGETVVRRKAHYKMSVIYDPSMDVVPGRAGGSDKGWETHLVWNFSVSGFDVAFGVYFQPLDPDRHGGTVHATRPVLLTLRPVVVDPLGLDESDDSDDPAATPGNATPSSATPDYSSPQEQSNAAPQSSATLAHSHTPPISIPPPPPLAPSPSHSVGGQGRRHPRSLHHGHGADPAGFLRLGRPLVPISKIRARAVSARDHSATGAVTDTTSMALAQLLAVYAPQTVSSPVSLTPATAAMPQQNLPATSSSSSYSSVSSASLPNTTNQPTAAVPSTATGASPVTGSFRVDGRHGVYTLVWDNSHSVVLSKTIRFAVGVVTLPSAPATSG
ncbi:hypothetical protein HK405_005956 [Cladochytrium tenue]|nr:hypothetical protein HK405_005956 [Cladochytrium tenue]